MGLGGLICHPELVEGSHPHTVSLWGIWCGDAKVGLMEVVVKNGLPLHV